MLERLRNLTASPRVEQRAALLSGKHITYTLKRSGRRRSIGLRIDDRGLTVTMPLRGSEKWLHSVLQEKADWVVEKLEGWQTRKPVINLWRDGETIDYLGEVLVLRVAQSLFACPLQRRGNQLWVFVDDAGKAELVEQKVTCWYRDEAQRLFELRARYYAQLLGVAPTAVKLTSATSQWGSCTAGGTVRLNVQLVKLPLRLIDYVVAHELAHLRELNHSEAFWRLVESVCPDYRKSRNELKGIAL
jgi:predicted metal-dependent hydrolase